MKNSITTRLLYLPFLLFVIVVSSIMLSPSVQEKLANAVSMPHPLNESSYVDLEPYRCMLLQEGVLPGQLTCTAALGLGDRASGLGQH